MTISATPRRVLVLAVVAALTCLVGAGTAAAACPIDAEPGTHCTVLTVPLDRSGRVPGEVHLMVERLDATRAATHAPLIALAGGPGQAATPFLGDFEFGLAPALRSRDLVVFDHRGTGRSDPLECPTLGPRYDAREPHEDIEACARHLGARRAFYTSRDNADDIEAIRQSLGVPKISLYGVSFGTYTAMTYARRYPDRVESLVLDSTLGPDGVDPYDRNTYAAYPRVLADVCGDGCAHITPDVVATLDDLVAHLRRERIRTHWIDGSGRRHRVAVGELAVRDLLSSGNFSPELRAKLPAAITAADAGDGALLARLYSESSSADYSPPVGDGDPGTVLDDEPVYYATHCEELPVAWDRMAPFAGRPAALRAAIGSLPATQFAPFSPTLEALWGESSECLRWPEAGAESPIVSGPIPDVPALILEGVDDTRTPIANGTQVAALLPHSQLLTVPYTGHAVLLSDPTNCTANAIRAFYGGRRVAACDASQRVAPLTPLTPLPPASLAAVDRRPGIGRGRRTLTAVELTLNDVFDRLDGLLSEHQGVGGLRSGYLDIAFRRRSIDIEIHRFSYVPGVTVSGRLRVGNTGAGGRLTIGGGVAARGSLSLTDAGVLEGDLDGRHYRTRVRP